MKNIIIFYLKIFIFGGKIFSICEYACFRNGMCDLPKVYKFTFLLVFSVEMAPKTKGGKERRSKKENVNPSQGGRTVMVRSP